MRRFVPLLLVAGLAFGAPGLVRAELPAGWMLRGAEPESYEASLDSTVRVGRRPSLRIAATGTPMRFGTVMKTVSAEPFRGRRLRLTARVRTANVGRWVGLWMRVDGKDPRVSLAFDNMGRRPILGTTDWQSYAIVLDVPEGAVRVAYGCILDGVGAAWIDDLKLRRVSTRVPCTGWPGDPNLPSNLDFEE